MEGTGSPARALDRRIGQWSVEVCERILDGGYVLRRTSAPHEDAPVQGGGCPGGMPA